MQRSALCRSRRELSNAYLLAKFGLDTAENEPWLDSGSPWFVVRARVGAARAPSPRTRPGPRGVQRGVRRRATRPAPGRRPTMGVRERRLAKFRQNVARFRLYRLRFLQVLADVELPCIVLSVYDLVSSSGLNKRIYFFKRVRGGSKIFRALRARTSS